MVESVKTAAINPGKRIVMKEVSEPSALERMIHQQLVERGIHSRPVLEAMRNVPRERFFPDEIRDFAYADRAAPIGHGQTISQPYIVALMTECLALSTEHRVLEVGTGSGYQTAVLSQLAGEVFTVERIKPLLDEAFDRLLGLGVRNIHYRFGDGSMGWPEQAPFDRIIITAGAPDVPRQLLTTQLCDGGVAVLPVGQQDMQMLVEIRRVGQRLETREICSCRFVKLVGQAGWPEEG